MEDAILNFKTQLTYVPEVKNAEKLKSTEKFIVCGMGGSALPAGFLRAQQPDLDLLVHRDYGLPRVPEYFLRESLIIVCSFSGETEEAIDAFGAAVSQNLNVAVVTGGGRLLKLAQEKKVPYVELPAPGFALQPRLALGYFLRALAKLMGLEKVLAETELLASTFDPANLKSIAGTLASRLKGKIPLLYTGTVFYPLAYAWKIQFNETAKIPAFANVLPEADHNEIAGAGLLEAGSLPNFRPAFYALMLTDSPMDTRLKRRFEATEALYARRGIDTETIEFTGENSWEKLLSSFLLGAWTSVELAKLYQIDPETNPVIEDFKRRIIEGGIGKVS